MKDILIIGGGVAGLAAGIYGQLNGYSTTIIEKNAVAGGECMGWNRENHHIDGCIHWLVGTLAHTPMHDAWKTVGALNGVDIFHPEAFLMFKHGPNTVGFYRDIKRIEQEWIALSPQDEATIREFITDIKRLYSFEVPAGKPLDLMTLKEKITLML